MATFDSKRHFAIAALLVLASSCRGCDETRRPAEPVSDAAPNRGSTPAFDAEPYRSRANVPAISYAAATRERTVLVSSVGDARVETPFEAASIAKTILATCVMILVEEGALDLDADVSRYVGFDVRHPRDRAPITLRALLVHTASIHDRIEETAARGGVPLGDFLRGYLTLDSGGPRAAAFLDAGPGAEMEYSNVGASLAALAVERTAKASFAEYAKRRVFEPLGMRATWFGDAKGGPSAPAAPHVARAGGLRPIAPPSHALYPAVDLFATSGDLARFARAILREGELDGARFLSRDSVRAMLRVQTDAAPDEALGWQLRSFDGRHVAGHEGEDEGASTGLYVDLEAGVAAIVLANGDAFQSGDPTRARALGSLVEDLLALARRQ